MNARVREYFDRGLGAVFLAFGALVAVYMTWAIFDSGQWGYLGMGLLSVTLLVSGWSKLFPRIYDPIPVDPDDPIMKVAIENSRAQLNRLIEGLGDNRKQPFVKFQLDAPDGGTEHIWGIVHSLEDRQLTVSLANDPVESQPDLDPRLNVQIDDIEDWILVAANGDTEGGFTMGAMAEIYKREFGWLPSALKKELRVFKDLDLDSLFS